MKRQEILILRNAMIEPSEKVIFIDIITVVPCGTNVYLDIVFCARNPSGFVHALIAKIYYELQIILAGHTSAGRQSFFCYFLASSGTFNISQAQQAGN